LYPLGAAIIGKARTEGIQREEQPGGQKVSNDPGLCYNRL
jgi:hypothetical protein